MKYDVICPVRLINENFEENVKAWFREVPIKTLFIGVNNEKILNRIKELPYENIEVINQTHYETLGICLTDLMKRVTTEWFVYFHGDARPSEHSFEQMMAFMNGKIGIIESEHLHIENGKKVYNNYYDEPRSYSGFQIMYRPAIESLVQTIEDDYIYRNEELITQNVCEYNGFEHKKCYAMHYHYITEINDDWTYTTKKTQEMQWKGLIKYCPLVTKFMTKLIIGTVRYNISEFGVKLEEVLEFTKKNNEIWLDIIKEYFGVKQ